MSEFLTKEQNQSYTYQHIQGCMLLRLNKLAGNIKLSHSEYRMTGILIGLYNKKQQKAFPSLDYLTKVSNMSRSTVIRTLKRLVELNLLIVVKTAGKKNSYYFSKILLEDTRLNITNDTPTHVTDDTPHDHELIDKTNKINISFKNNDDDFINISDYQDLLKKLESWNFTGSKQLIKKYGVKKTQNLIKIVEDKQPQNAGAYLRALIKGLGQNINGKINFDPRMPEHGENEPLINKMIKHKFWKHKPSDKVLQVLPDVGKHLLIKYYKDEDMVMFLDSGLCDKLEAFELI